MKQDFFNALILLGASLHLLSPKRGADHRGSAHQAQAGPEQRTVGLPSPPAGAEAAGRAPVLPLLSPNQLVLVLREGSSLDPITQSSLSVVFERASVMILENRNA